MNRRCPQCGNPYLQRVRRIGFVERALSLAYIYPFRCQVCTHRFLHLQWGVRYVKSQADVREYVRLPIQLPVGLWRETGEEEQRGVVTDLSMVACTVEARMSMEVGDVLRLRMESQDRAWVIAEAAAVVRSVRPPRAGLEFVEIAPSDKDRLSRFVTSLWADHDGETVGSSAATAS